MSLLPLQRRVHETLRARMGDRGPKGEPRRRTTWRLTSHNRDLLDAAQRVLGGEVRAWTGTGAPEGHYELDSGSDTLRVAIAPGVMEPITQAFEAWSGGGCVRRCDGAVERLSGSPCICREEGYDPLIARDQAEVPKEIRERICQPHTRFSFWLPELGSLGVCRLETKGWNAAMELPTSVQALNTLLERHSDGGIGFVTGMLRIVEKTAKKNGQTRRYVVPQLDLDVVMADLLGAGTGDPALGAGDRAVRAIGSGDDTSVEPPPEPEDSSPPAPVLTVPKRRALFAAGREAGHDEAGIRATVREITGSESTASMGAEHYEAIMARFRAEKEGVLDAAWGVAERPGVGKEPS